MPISFGPRPREDDVLALIAAKSYGRAIERIKARLRGGGPSPSLRMQLADVLILADRRPEAVALLLPLAEQYAAEGFAAKAVSVLKKVQKIEPGRRDVETRLAQLIQQKQREAPRLELPGDGGAALEIGLDLGAVSVPAERQPAQAVSAPRPERLPEGSPVLDDPDATLPFECRVKPAPQRGEPDLEDYDLLYAESESPAGPGRDSLPALDRAAGEAHEPPMSPRQFADELISLVDTAFGETAPPAGENAAVPAAAGGAIPGSRIVVSPLFRDFSVDEMVAVIQGLRLLAFQRGEVILREGDRGGSLYMLTSGRVRAFRRDAATGKQLPIGDLREGAFFGEISVLTGQPRTASVVALTPAELLELDRPTLDSITKTHPRVSDVLREFAAQRAAARRA